jgi:4-amino-4-deoxy-L-arabinose transferase
MLKAFNIEKKVSVIIFVLFFLIYILPLNVRPLVIPDETRYAEIGREIVETGDWIVPRLNGLRYFEKPMLGHWLNALSIKLIGENAFAIRLPSALSVGLTALILFFVVRHFTGSTPAAAIAASVFLTCLEIFAVGTFCVLDSIFSMFVTASMVALFIAFIEANPTKRTIFLVGAGFACGLAFLTKGFLAFVLPAIVFVPLAIWQNQLKKLLRIFWLPVTIAVLTALPWAIMVHLKEPDFWHYFFWVEHIDRFISPQGGQHPYPLWFFVPVVLIGTLPWTIQLGEVIFKQHKHFLNNPLLRFSICWFLFPFLFFSICRGKLVTYILPCFPPLIVLFTAGIHQEWKTLTDQRSNHFNRVGIILILALMIGLVLTQEVIPSTKIYRPQEVWKWLFILVGLLMYGVFLVLADISTNHIRKFFLSCMAPIVLMFSAPFVIPDKLIEKKAPIKFLNQYKNKINQNTILVSDNYLTPAVCWSYKRSNVFLLNNPGEFDYGLEYDDSTKQRMLNIEQLREIITKNSDKKHMILITSTKRYIEYNQQLPKPVFENTDCGFVLAEFAEGDS